VQYVSPALFSMLAMLVWLHVHARFALRPHSSPSPNCSSWGGDSFTSLPVLILSTCGRVLVGWIKVHVVKNPCNSKATNRIPLIAMEGWRISKLPPMIEEIITPLTDQSSLISLYSRIQAVSHEASEAYEGAWEYRKPL
jgi:hypothetical protein